MERVVVVAACRSQVLWIPVSSRFDEIKSNQYYKGAGAVDIRSPKVIARHEPRGVRQKRVVRRLPLAPRLLYSSVELEARIDR